MTRWLLLPLLIVGFLAGAIAFAPLEAALRMSGADKRGLQWSSAEGTILSGRLNGILIKSKPYGDAELKLAAFALFGGQLKYAVDWTSEHGQGSGDVAVGPGNRVSLSNFDIDLDLLQLEQAARWIQQSGGRIRLQGDVVQFNGSGCVNAEGKAESDVLERNEEILGTGWSQMQGELGCENGELVIPLESQNNAGTQFRAQLRLAPNTTGRFEARVSGLISRELMFALPIAGFAPDGRDLVYSYAPAKEGGPT